MHVQHCPTDTRCPAPLRVQGCWVLVPVKQCHSLYLLCSLCVFWFGFSRSLSTPFGSWFSRLTPACHLSAFAHSPCCSSCGPRVEICTSPPGLPRAIQTRGVARWRVSRQAHANSTSVCVGCWCQTLLATAVEGQLVLGVKPRLSSQAAACQAVACFDCPCRG